MPKLSNCYNISDLRKKAKRKLPAPMFHYIDGGTDDEWTLLLLRNCFMGVRRFDDFQQQLGLTRHILANRLKKLVEEAVLEKIPYGKSTSRFEYKLTHKGKDLYPVVLSLVNWGNK